MPLVSMKGILQRAKEEQYAVGHYNLNSLQWAIPILQAAEEERAPVILASSDRLVDRLGGFRTIAAVIRELVREMSITVPVVLHLDHAQSVDRCKRAMEAGYTSVMIDGSKYPIDENIAMTREVTEYARAYGVSVEAEVGIVGGSEDGMEGSIRYADPGECLRMVKEAQIDALAAALGSVHGPYRGEPRLNFERMKEISERTDVPLVLHGGSGLPDDQIQRAIRLGHAKINVNTECAQAWTDAVRDFLTDENNARVYEPQVILKPAHEAIKRTVKEKIRLFGTGNRC
ncbi:MAG: class II fructose-1,6-bisphosphate aldolase [Planifilum sp.]|jgi:6-phospho-5-dehydro-2-deoxy-D-gluconate aldolase